MSGLVAILRRCLGNRRGNSLMQFAFIAPVFFTVMFGTIDFGRAMWLSSTLKHIATEGSRYAAVRGANNPTPASANDVRAFVRNRAVGLDPATLTIDVTWTPDNTSGSTVTVQVQYPFEYLMIGFLPLSPINMDFASTMVVG
jgi:Flp pilus assembly protein TadG